MVDGKVIHELNSELTHPMKTSIILRTNRHGAMPDAILEVAQFRYRPV